MKNLLQAVVFGTFLVGSGLAYAGPLNNSILEDGSKDKGELTPGKPYKAISLMGYEKKPLSEKNEQFFNTYVECIRQSPRLESLKLIGFQARSSEEAQAVHKGLKKKGSRLTRSEDLSIRTQCAKIREGRMNKLADALKGMKLKELFLGGGLDEDDMALFAPVLKDMVSLETVDFTQNFHFRDGGLRFVTPMVKGWKNLKGLYFSHCKLTDFGVKPLLEALHGHPSLMGLSLAFNEISHEMVNPVLAFLETCPTLVALQLRGNRGGSSRTHKYSSIVHGQSNHGSGFCDGPSGDQLIQKYMKKQGWNFLSFPTLKQGGFVIAPRNTGKNSSKEPDLFKMYGSYLRS